MKSVSYTHLRAHETPEHLVCRLLLENVFVSNRISLYSDYLDNPANIDLDYTINTEMKINKYLTTNLIIQFIYDHNSVKRLQVREVMGIGLSLDI